MPPAGGADLRLLDTFRFEFEATDIGTGFLGVVADISIARWAGHTTRNIGVSGRKIGGFGIKCEIENATNNSFDLVVHIVYPSANANMLFDARFGILKGLQSPSVFDEFVAGTATISVAQEAEANALYQPGGAGVSDF